MSVFGKNSGALLAKVNPNITDPPGNKKDPPKDSKPDFGDGQTKANALGSKNNIGPDVFVSANPAYDPKYELAGLSKEQLEKINPDILAKSLKGAGINITDEDISQGPKRLAFIMESTQTGPFDEVAQFIREKGGINSLSDKDMGMVTSMEIRKMFGSRGGSFNTKDGFINNEDVPRSKVMGQLADQGIFLIGNDMGYGDDPFTFVIDRRGDQFADDVVSPEIRSSDVNQLTEYLNKIKSGTKTEPGQAHAQIDSDNESVGKPLLDKISGDIQNIENFMNVYTDRFKDRFRNNSRQGRQIEFPNPRNLIK